MLTSKALKEKILNGGCDKGLSALYPGGEGELAFQRARYAEAISGFEESFGQGRQVALYSAPGRTEIVGNHTDHNNGLAMGAAVNLDVVAVVALNEGSLVRVQSRGFSRRDDVDVAALQPVEREKGRSSALVRGIAAGFARQGGRVGGFDAYTTSRVIKGSGLSSSAAFEMCLATVINREFNEGRFTPVEIALFGQLAENVFFGKPTGVLDQISCATGGAVMIDFADGKAPAVQAIPFDLDSYGYKMIITDTKGDHANLTPDYAAIRAEMEAVAAYFGKEVLRQVEEGEVVKNIAPLREKLGDRAVLRALHFYGECRRVKASARAIKAHNLSEHLAIVLESGHSSFEYNQNAYSAAKPARQGVSLGLALSQEVLRGQGAWRLQGGGFAGTIQAYVPHALVQKYISTLEGVFGEGACHVIGIRRFGGACLTPEGVE